MLVIMVEIIPSRKHTEVIEYIYMDFNISQSLSLARSLSLDLLHVPDRSLHDMMQWASVYIYIFDIVCTKWMVRGLIRMNNIGIDSVETARGMIFPFSVAFARSHSLAFSLWESIRWAHTFIIILHLLFHPLYLLGIVSEIWAHTRINARVARAGVQIDWLWGDTTTKQTDIKHTRVSIFYSYAKFFFLSPSFSSLLRLDVYV